MKKFLIFLSIVCIIGGACLVAFSGIDLVNQDWESIFDRFDSSNHVFENYTADQLHSQTLTFKTDLVDASVIVKYDDLTSQNLIATLSYPDDEENSKCNANGIEHGILTVSQHQKNHFWWSWAWFRVDNFVELTLDNSLRGKVILDIDTQAGGVNVVGEFEKITIQVEAGSVRLEDITSNQKIDIVTQAGSIRLTNATAPDISLQSDVGSINCIDTTTSNLTLKNQAGSITAKNITADTLIASSQVGSISCQDSTIADITLTNEAGSIRCGQLKNVASLTAKNQTGSINIEIIGNIDEYTIKVKRDIGSSNISDQTGSTGKFISLENSVGSIKLYFS